MIPWLSSVDEFPPVDTALADPNGLLCAGADLTADRILQAYRRGIFPWFSPGQPVLWWSPNPRMVLFPHEIRISRSLTRVLRKDRFRVSIDRCFGAVIEACAATPRKSQTGTWITDAIVAGYGALHQRGLAHSVETWDGDTLVGGLYGVAIGKVFFGESMFTRATDASKVAFAHMVRHIERHRFELIDCQMKTDHLSSLGAREIPRATFCAEVERLTNDNLTSTNDAAWQRGFLTIDW